MPLDQTSNDSYFTYSSPWRSSSSSSNGTSTSVSSVSSRDPLASKYGATYNTQQAYGDPNRYRSFSSSSSSTSSDVFSTTDSTSFKNILSQMAQITDSLYLCAMSALDTARLRQLGITLVVSAVAEKPPSFPGANVDVLHVTVEDYELTNLSAHFDRVADRIDEEVHRSGRVVVHCMAGISRSSSLVLAYLMKYQKMTLREAFHLVRSRRPCVQPNVGFWRQLLDYEERLYGHRSVKMISNHGQGIGNDAYPDVLEREMGSKGSSRLAHFLGNLGIRRSPWGVGSMLNRLQFG